MAKFRSIKIKIVTPLAIFIVAVALFTAAYFPYQESRLINGIFHERLRKAVDTLALGIGISMNAGSLDGANATVSLLERDANLAFLLVLDEEDEVLLRMPESGALIPVEGGEDLEGGLGQLLELEEQKFVELNSYLVLKDRISFDGEMLGTAIIGLNTAEREREIFRSVVITLVLSLLLAVIGISFLQYVTRSVIIQPIQRSVRAAELVATGDLTAQIESIVSDELGQLLTSIAAMTQNLRSLIGQTQRSGIQITSSVTQIAASGKQLEATVTEQAASTNQVVATAKEISATSQELANTMHEVSSMAEETVGSADRGHQGLARMESTMHQMEEATQSIASKLAAINEKAGNITSVVTTITKVADQTNLLSLNAAIEAEKAGEFGVGFAVVAREIRRLADQTAVATLDIEQTVKEMRSAVAAGVMSMDKFSEQVRQGVEEVSRVGAQLAEIIEQVQALMPRFEAVAEGMGAQSEGAQQISDSMIQLNEGAQQTADSLRETNRSLEKLTQAARELQEEITHFKTE
jgi:methyl-accepting chemotaxis protein